LSIDYGTLSTPVRQPSLNLMNFLTRLAPQPSAEGRPALSTVANGERAGQSMQTIGKALKIRKPAVAILATAIFSISAISHLFAADPSVEVFTQDRMVADEAYGDVSLLPQFPFRWFVTVNGGYNDNVNATPEGAGSPFSQAYVTLTKDLRTERTQLRMILGGGVTYYFDLMNDSTDYKGNLNFTVQHNISERLAVAAAINALYTSEPQFGTDLGSVRRTNYFSTNNTFSARYFWTPRLATYTSYQLATINYEDEVASLAQDRVDHTLGESIRYSFSPRTTLIGEYRFELIDYETAPRDSTTHLAIGGLEYQFTPRLSATVLGGATFRKFDEGSADQFIDPNASASLNYRFSPSASLNWTADYSVEEPNSTETLTQITLRTRTGLKFIWQPTSRLITDLAVSYYHDENTSRLSAVSPELAPQDFNQDGFELLLEAKYVLADRVALDLKYAHTNLDSVGGYSRNVYTAGLAFKF